MAGVPFVGLTGGLGAGKSEALRALEELVRDIDLLVYRLEPTRDPIERDRLRRELEAIRDRLERAARDLDR